MDYEKKYKEALEKAKESLKDGGISQNSIDYIQSIFPELKESEDEKIRKAILELVKQSSEILEKKNQEQMIAWLEKQVERKPADLEEFINELSKQFPDVSFAKLSRIAVRVAKWVKPCWGEENKKHIIDIIDYLDDYYSFAKDEYEDVADGVLNEIRWLQRIQERL